MAKKNPNLDKSMKNIQDSIDQMYQTTYYNSPSSAKALSSLTDRINASINGITSYNMSSTGTPNVSKLYNRLKMSNNDSIIPGDRGRTTDIGNKLFDDAIGFDDFYSNFMQNRYLVEVDAEIDAVCKYFPELVEALEVKKEGVLCADHFNKDFLTLKKANGTDKDGDASFEEESSILKTRYDLLNLIDDIYDKTARYGEQFLYVVPYSIALGRLLADKSNTVSPLGAGIQRDVHEGAVFADNREFKLSVSNNRFTITDVKGSHVFANEACVMLESSVTKGGKTLPPQYADVLDANESFELKVELCTSGIVESVVKDAYYTANRRSHLAESASAEYDRVLLEKNGGLEIVQKNKTTGQLEIRGKENELVANTSSDGLFNLDHNKNAEDDGRPVEVPGCVVARLKREQVIPIFIGESNKSLGYYYIEICSAEAMQDFQGYNYIMADSLTSIRGSNSANNAPFNVVDPMRQEKLLQYLAGQLSTFIDRQFIQANQDLRDEIYMILKQNDLFNTASIDKIKVSFIPPEDMHHFYFKLDPKSHRGISDLEKAMVPAKIYACMYITDAIAQMVRGQDKRVFYVRQNVETNISKTLMNTIQQIKQGNFGLRQFSSINNVLNMTGKFNDFVIPTNASGDSPVQIEVLQGQQFNDNTERMNQLKEMAINSVDVPFEIIQTRQSVDYAMQLSMSSSRFLRKVYHRQGQYAPLISRLITKLYRYEFGKKDEIEAILPPPMFLNMANTNQLVDNIKQYVTTVTEYEMNNIEDEKIKNMYMEEVFKFYVGTHVELSEHEKILKRVQAKAFSEKEQEEE